MSKKSDSNFRSKFSFIFGTPRNTSAQRAPAEEFYLNDEILKELGRGCLLQNRIKRLKDLSETVEEKRLEKHSIESLWLAIQDILKTGPNEARHNVIGFLCTLVSSQYKQLGSMRQELFQYITSCHGPDDLEPCFQLLKSLTHNGMDIHLLEEQIGGYMLDLLPQMVQRNKLVDVLSFLGNMTKMNATYVDEGVISAVIRHCCSYSYRQPIEEVEECINYIEIAVQYAIIPSTCIPAMLQYISSVRCIITKRSPLSQSLNKVMRMLVSSKTLGHTIIYTMCSFLESAPLNSFISPLELQRSTLFLLSTTLWNKNRTLAEQHYCNAVLPSVLKAIKSRDDGIVIETLESLKFYLRNHGNIIEHISWDTILDILAEIVQQQKEAKFRDANMVEQLNALLDEAEQLYTVQTCGVDKLYFEIIENCVDIRSEESITNLMTHKERLIVPGTLNWCDNLLLFMTDFYHCNKRPDIIRLKALERFWVVVEQFYQLYEEELLEKVVLRVLDSVHTEPNTKLRHRAVMLLAQLSYRCNSSPHFYSILNIILKVISVVVQNNEENESILICDELIRLFLYKVSRTPSRHALQIYTGLVKLATGFYSSHFTQFFPTTAKIRYKILECLWRISMSPSGETIVYGQGKIIYCHFLNISSSNICIRPQEVTPQKLELDVPTEKTADCEIVNLPYDQVDHLMYHCLDKENDWEVLRMTLCAIKKRLCNRMLLQRTDTDLHSLTSQLVKLLHADHTERVSDLTNLPKGYSTTDLKANIFPVLVRLIPYQGSLYRETGETDTARKLINALVCGLMPKFAKTCIEGLTLALVEMPKLIIRPLKDILLQMSKIAAGRSLALSTLTFLSALAHNPELYKDFVEKQYKLVIGVILPYTDPVKFAVYTIHFAHVVVCDWYVRCHHKHRPAFKDFILGQLRATVKSVDPRKPRSSSLTQYQEQNYGKQDKRKASAESKDRSLRPRSGDFGRLSGSNTPRGSMRSNTSADSSNKCPDPESMIAHNQLIDVTEDLLERWMFAGRCNIIKKSPQLDLLFANKKIKTWVVGNTLITISTSKTCEESSAGSCKRCLMVQAIMGDRSFNSLSPEESQESYSNNKIPIPGQPPEPPRAANFAKILTPKCSCWVKDWAHLEIRSPTGNSSIVLRLQNKCHFVGFDSAVGGDSHVISSLFDDDLTQLLVRDVLSDYSSQFMEHLDSNSSSGGERKKMPIRRRRLSTPDADDMTPTAAIEVRPRSLSDVGFTGKSDPLMEEDNSSTVNELETCEILKDKPNNDVLPAKYNPEKRDTLTENDILEAFNSSKHRKGSTQIFKYAKNRLDQPPDNEEHNREKETRVNSHNSSTISSPQNTDKSPATSRSGSSHDIPWSRSSSMKDCSRFSVDNDQVHSDIDPAFIFRLLYPLIPYNAESGPINLPVTEDLARSLRALDLILISNTHKIGVIYVGPGQNKEVSILRNTYGSVRYVEFLQNLGDMIWLQNIDQSTIYVGGLDTQGGDGDYTISWRDKTTQVVFHIATMMPQHTTDPTSTNKKRHIGNNFVTIVYNDSGMTYTQGTIKGQCNFCDVVVEPQTSGMNLITFMSTTKTALSDLKPHGALLVSDAPLAMVTRQLAVNANSVCQVMRGSSGPGKGSAYSCNWLERLKKIKKIQSRSITPVSSPTPGRRETHY